VPAGLPDNAFDDIPEAPGVYLFYGDNNVALYIGKSVNLRARVMSHFSGDYRVVKDMRIAQQVKRIDWIKTAGELGALIQESHLIKRLAPVYNQRLRRATDLCSWHWQAQQEDRAPQLVSACDLDPAQFGDLYGLFRTRRNAIEALRELATAHELCPILLGLEKKNGPCFAYQLKRCRGACVGAESRARHALRLAQAFTSMRMQPWPFRGRIGVRETGSGSEAAELHVLDRWCYLGTVRSEQELHEMEAARTQPAFDLDTYKILTRFLSQPRGKYTVVELAA